MKIRPSDHPPSLVIFILFLLFCIPAAGQTNLEAKVDEYVKNHLAGEKIPGISVAVMREGKIILAKGYGLANVEHNVPVKPETVFQSGSVGKAFTVVAIMMLVDEGKLKLDDEIKKYLTDAPPEWDGGLFSDHPPNDAEAPVTDRARPTRTIRARARPRSRRARNRVGGSRGCARSRGSARWRGGGWVRPRRARARATTRAHSPAGRLHHRRDDLLRPPAGAGLARGQSGAAAVAGPGGGPLAVPDRSRDGRALGVGRRDGPLPESEGHGPRGHGAARRTAHRPETRHAPRRPQGSARRSRPPRRAGDAEPRGADRDRLAVGRGQRDHPEHAHNERDVRRLAKVEQIEEYGQLVSRNLFAIKSE